MSILVNKDTRLLVQGITGREGEFHTKQMIEYGTKVVGGVVPGRGGQKFEDKVPIFDTCRDAVRQTGADVSCVMVPAAFAGDAVCEAVEAGCKLVVCVTEGIPTLDMVRVRAYLERSGARMIGPNSPGVITPGECKVGIMPAHVHKPGHVGVVSRSGTLTYEAVGQLTALGIGQSTCLGIGGDPVGGMDFIDVLSLFNQDPDTHGVIMIGEIGGSAEEDAAAWVKANMRKPVTAFIAGATAPAGKRMGHAGAIIAGGKGTAAAKQAALREAGIAVAPTPAEMGTTLKSLLR